MKKIYFSLIALAGLSLASCTNDNKANENEVAAVERTYYLDRENTELEWEGSYVADGHKHNGTIDVTEGTIVYNGDEFVSADFNVDLNTLKNEDLKVETGKDKLEGHLKTADFFDASKQAIIPVKITQVNAKDVMLTMNVAGKDLNYTVPVSVNKTDDAVTIKGKFDIDFAQLDANGFKAADASKADERTHSIVKFDLDLKAVNK